jgi:hypothetical protein
MNKAHVTLLALLLAGAAVLGSAALSRTTALGHSAQHANDAALAARTKQLSTYAAKLRQELRAKPPRLPAIPKQSAAVAAPAPRPQAPRIVYHQPPPVVVTVHRSHGDDGSHETEGGGGGGGDD